ncbi:MAG: hypothetical protein JO134_18820 [Xanthobacteraceae bacterium]|nr:hypothetical protein [Xanthobacteraceae bacterium]
MRADEFLILKLGSKRSRLGEIQPWPAHVERERLENGVAPFRVAQTSPDCLVQHLPKRLAASAHLFAQHRLNVRVQRDCGSDLHHDAMVVSVKGLLQGGGADKPVGLSRQYTRGNIPACRSLTLIAAPFSGAGLSINQRRIEFAAMEVRT